MFGFIMKQIILICTYIFVILLGYYLNENVKKITASTLGYKTIFEAAYGRCMFYNEDMFYKFNSIKDEYKSKGDFKNGFKKDKRWLELVKLDTRNYAFIELSSYIFTIFISILGFSIWKSRRKQSNELELIDYISLIMCLFYMRNIIVIGYGLLIRSHFCDEFKLWQYFGFQWFYIDIIPFTLGIILLLYIIFKIIQYKIRLNFTICVFL